MRPFFALPILVIAACVQTPAETAASAQREAADADRLATTLAGFTPGQPQTCLPLTGTRQAQTEAYGRTILYRYSRGLIYRSDTSGGCERIARGDALVTRQVGGQLCAGDIATTFDAVARIQTGSCSFGPFIAYRRP
jgi:hypothetical protein